MQLPKDHQAFKEKKTFVIHSNTPETLFYSNILLGHVALISSFPTGIQAKRKVKSVEEASK